MKHEERKLLVTFIYAEKDRESILADAFGLGVKKGGDDVRKVRKGQFREDLPLDADVYCMVGVKSLRLFRQLRAAGKHVVFFDKGYFRHRGPGRVWEYWRVAVNDHHPTDYVADAQHGPKRWERTAGARAVFPKEWRQEGGHIVYAGSSEKYHAFAGLPGPTAYAEKVIAEIKQRTKRSIIYRPKPTWFDAVPIDGAAFSGRDESLLNILKGAHCLVTNGSNSAYDSLVEGIPCIVLGRGVARPISSTSLDDIENPRMVSDPERLQWFSNLAWCQFTEVEMQSGLAWQAIRPQLFGQSLDDAALDEVAGVAMRPTKAILKKSGQWRKDWKKVRTKEEQRALKPFSKKKIKETPEEMW